MKRKFSGGFVAMLAMPLFAQTTSHLDLTLTDLDRLGVELQSPQTVTEAEVASGLASVVVPPSHQSIITSTVAGVLSRILVAEGDLVAAGQPLAEIRSVELLELQRDFVEASMALDLAGAQHKRDQELYAEGIIAERRVLESAAAQRSAATVLEQLRQQLLLAGLDETELDQLRATRRLSPNLTLRAPVAATVVNQAAALGTHVDAMDPVYRIADLSELWLELRVPQERSGQIQPGMRIAVNAADRLLTGTVSMIGRVTDESSQTVMVRGRIDDGDNALRAGQVLSARILTSAGDESNVVAVPNAAIVRKDGQTHVFRVRDGGIAAVPVEVIGEDGTLTYINGDLGSADRTATGGVATLKYVWLAAEGEGE